MVLVNNTYASDVAQIYDGNGNWTHVGDFTITQSLIALDATFGSSNELTIDASGNVNTTGSITSSVLTANTANFGDSAQFAIDANGNATTSGSLTFDSATLYSETSNFVSQLTLDTNENSDPTKFVFKNAAGLELLGLDSNGNATIAGTLTTTVGNYDIAEDYPTRDDSIEAGDIVSADDILDGFVKKSNKSYDKNAIGIYSEKPGFRLSQAGGTINGERAIPIALAGRVPVKVTGENGPIRKGDALTTSSTPGYAMKATKAGQIIGKALSDFNGDSGRVLAFVNVSFADPQNILERISLDTDNSIIVSKVSSDNVKLPANLNIAGVESNGTLTGTLMAIGNEISNVKTGLSAIETAVLGIGTKTDELSDKVLTLEEQQASTAAELARTSTVASSTSATLADLNTRLDALLAQIASSSTTASTSAEDTGSASYNALVEELTSVDALIATGSSTSVNFGVTSSAGLGDEIEAYNLTVDETFKSLGLSYLGSTSISGDVTVAGTSYLSDTSIVGIVTIDNIRLTESSINVEGGTLYIQNSPLSGDVDIFSGAVTIQQDGTISAKGNIKVEGDLQIEGAITTTAIAGENLKAKDVLYVSDEGVVGKADSSIPEKSVVIGIAAKDAKKGSVVTIVIGGKARGFNTLETGKKYYLKAGGGLTPTPTLNNEKVPVGVALSSSELIMQIGE